MKKRRDALVERVFTPILRALEARLTAHGGRYFADDRLTVADLKVGLWLRYLRSGLLDHVPTDLIDRVAPALTGYMERVLADPGVTAYYARR
jgi:glutathione S-transferase